MRRAGRHTGEWPAMADASSTSFLPPIVAFCAAAVVAVPLARRLGLGGVLGYMLAGILIGPSVLGIIRDPASVRHVAELGVVLLLFIIGLELKVSRLLSMRQDIFGLGAAQMMLTGFAVGAVSWSLGISVTGSVVVGIAFALSATAVALQLLDERGDLQLPYGQKTFAILLFQDLSIVPILALVPLIAPVKVISGDAGSYGALRDIGIALAAIAAVFCAGRYLLNPLFRILAPVGAREIMTAAALLIVLGSAMLMEMAGLSMALGAFLAGLLLAESNFKHQLEADIEPFRGLLLGLFFMSVGMGLELRILSEYIGPLLVLTGALIVLKIILAAGLLRLRSSTADSWRAAALLSPAGEFSFVLIPMALGFAMLTPVQATLATAIAALTMLLGPLVAKAIDAIIARREAARAAIMSDLPEESFDGASGSVLVIGFGRFGQMVNQVMLTEGVDVTVIDTDVEVIQVAPRFGVKVYFGDGARLDVLHAAGAARARVIAVCVDKPEVALHITEIVHAQFPLAKLYVRAYDRRHAINLVKAGADFHMRETLLSALNFGGLVLREIGVSAERARTVVDDVRRRDEERLLIQQSEGMMGGAHLLRPEPLTAPKTLNRGLSSETRAVIENQASQ